MKSLMNFGLTKNESIIYSTLIKIGESKASAIIKESGFKSGKIYQVLESLINKGLISFVIKNNIKYFSPQHPKKILDYINFQKQQIEEMETNFLTHLPKLNQLFEKEKDPCQIKVYEGVEGIRSALFLFLNQLKKGSTMLIYAGVDTPERDALLSWPQFSEIRLEKKILTRTIKSSLTEYGKRKRTIPDEKYKTYRLLKGSDVSNFMVGNNMVLLFNFDEPNCIFIENHAYAQQFKELFEVLWTNGKKL